MAGFIKLHRGWRDTDGLTKSASFSEHEAWLWLLENAAWKDMRRLNAKGEIVEIKRGEMHTSLRSLAKAWGWSKKRVQSFLTRLEVVTKLVTAGGQSGTHLTICNYRKYQDSGDGLGSDMGTAGGQPGDTQEEGKEGKEEKNTHYAFFGRVIHLTENDLARWRARYSNIPDIDAELGSLDDWLFGQDEKARKNWFHITSGALNKKHQAGTAKPDDGHMENFV